MTDQSQPNLTLGTPPKGLTRKTGGNLRGLLFVVIVLQLVLLAALWIVPRQAPSGSTAFSLDNRSPSDHRALALALEERSLALPAARAWERHLEDSPAAEDRSQIWYRVGKLYMDADDYSKAAAAFVKADLDGGADNELKEKTGRRTVDCLRKLGLYGEVSRELSRRVEVGGGSQGRGQVLATLAGEAITEADLDRMIERRVDQMLAMQGVGSEAQRKSLVQQLRSPQTASQLFQEMLQSELFSRRAQEMKLHEEEAFIDARELLEEQLLASQFLSRNLDKIQPTAVDLEAYYQAHQDDYRDEESDQILPFEAVQDRVYSDYASRKQQELAQQLFNDLMVRYDLKIVAMPGTTAPAALDPEEAATTEPGEEEQP